MCNVFLLYKGRKNIKKKSETIFALSVFFADYGSFRDLFIYLLRMVKLNF